VDSNTIFDTVCNFSQYEEFLITFEVKGVGENRPLIPLFQPIQFRIEVQGTVNMIIGIVIDIKLSTEHITVKMPSPCVAGWVKDKSEQGSPLSFWDFPHLPYLRFILAAFGLDTSWWEMYHQSRSQKVSWNFQEFRNGFGNFKGQEALLPTDPFEPLFDLRFGIGVSKAETLERCNLLAATLHYRQGGLDAEGVKSAEIELLSRLYHRQWRSTVTPTAKDNIRRLLVPSARGPNPPHRLPRPPATEELSYFNENINREQRHAVYDIVNGLHGDVPYLIWGPPGTGRWEQGVSEGE
jgi:hypothetical protein